MKRSIMLMSLCLVLGTSLFSQTYYISQKKMIVEDINRGQYNNAVKNFKTISWSYDKDEYDGQLDILKYDEFANIALKSGLSQLQAVSLYQYSADLLSDIANYFMLTENNIPDAMKTFDMALNYYHIAIQMMDEIIQKDATYSSRKHELYYSAIGTLFGYSLVNIQEYNYPLAEKLLIEAINLESIRQSIPNVMLKPDLLFNLEEYLQYVKSRK